MAWKRTKNGTFSPKQHERMVAMAKAGVSPPEIADEAGCSPVSVRRILRLKSEAATPTLDPTPATDNLVQENAYLRWLVSGIINHVGKSTYVDKLISDIGDGKFIP